MHLQLKVHLSRTSLDRKPYVVSFGGDNINSQALTPIRAAILLVLFADFIERADGASESSDIHSRVRSVLARLAPQNAAEVTEDAVRVALYRTGQFVEKLVVSELVGPELVMGELGTAAVELTLTVEKGALVVRAAGVNQNPSAIQVELSTDDPAISALLDETVATSPLSRIRRSKSLTLPPGNQAHDRLVAELLDHEYPVKQTTLCCRPSIQSLSPQLLAAISAAPLARKRQELSMKQLQRGSLRYTEVLPRKSLWELLDRGRGQAFDQSRARLTAGDIVEQLDHLAFLVRSTPAYELVLTDAFFPFFLTSFEVSRTSSVERFVLFLEYNEERLSEPPGVFAIKDDALYFSSHERIVRSVLSHPTTIRGREHVLIEIEAVRTALLDSTEDRPRSISGPVRLSLV